MKPCPPPPSRAPFNDLKPDNYAVNAKICRMVERFPCMYDRSHPYYLKKDVVEKAWIKIAHAMDDSIPSCKERWRNIRTSFARSINVRKVPATMNRTKPYYLHEELQFLTHHITPGVPVRYARRSNAPESPAAVGGGAGGSSAVANNNHHNNNNGSSVGYESSNESRHHPNENYEAVAVTDRDDDEEDADADADEDNSDDFNEDDDDIENDNEAVTSNAAVGCRLGVANDEDGYKSHGDCGSSIDDIELTQMQQRHVPQPASFQDTNKAPNHQPPKLTLRLPSAQQPTYMTPKRLRHCATPMRTEMERDQFGDDVDFDMLFMRSVLPYMRSMDFKQNLLFKRRIFDVVAEVFETTTAATEPATATQKMQTSPNLAAADLKMIRNLNGVLSQISTAHMSTAASSATIAPSPAISVSSTISGSIADLCANPTASTAKTVAPNATSSVAMHRGAVTRSASDLVRVSMGVPPSQYKTKGMSAATVAVTAPAIIVKEELDEST